MKILQIAVGIIRNQQHEIFITQRAADAHMANKLEFPGGKIEAGETPEQALIRELQEEVGITPTQSSLFEKLEYQFPDRHITLWFWLVESWEGEPWGKEGQPAQWIMPDAALPNPAHRFSRITSVLHSSRRFLTDHQSLGCVSLLRPTLPDRLTGSACCRMGETD